MDDAESAEHIKKLLELRELVRAGQADVDRAKGELKFFRESLADRKFALDKYLADLKADRPLFK